METISDLGLIVLIFVCSGALSLLLFLVIGLSIEMLTRI